MLGSGAVAERSRVVVPGVSVVPTGYGIVPVATYEVYGRAIAVVRAVADDIAAVTSRRGPLVPPSRLDVWLDSSALIGQEVMPQAITLGGFGSIMLLPGLALHSGPWTNPIPAAVYWAMGGACFLAFCAGIYMRRADIRIARHKLRAQKERFSAADVDAMLTRFTAASPDLRSVTRAAVAAQTTALRPHMDAAAVERLEVLLADAHGERLHDGLASEVACLAAEVIARSPGADLAQRTERVMQRLTHPSERVVVADALAALSDAKKSA